MRRTSWVLGGALALGLVTAVISSGSQLGIIALNVMSSGAEAREQRHLAYGPGPRQYYHLYEPLETGAGPVIVFFHGGSWDSGEPEDYAWLARAFIPVEFATATVAYRLAPDVDFPAFIEDAAAAIVDIRSRLGPDRPIFVMGHSAGAQIAALVALDPQYLAAHDTSPCALISGLIGVAGPYDFLPLKEERYKRIFPEALRPASQPVNFTEGTHPPALLLHGLADETVHAEDSERLDKGLTRSGNRVTLKLYGDADHSSILGSIAPLLRGAMPTFDDIVTFIEEERASGYPGCG